VSQHVSSLDQTLANIQHSFAGSRGSKYAVQTLNEFDSLSLIATFENRQQNIRKITQAQQLRRNIMPVSTKASGELNHHHLVA